MNTKLLMSLSAIFMAVLGITASFAPQEIVRHYGFNRDGLTVLPIQVAGALYLGFAILNWMARANLMGGIYSRPVALGNLVHFAVVAIALLKIMTGGLSRSGEIITGSIVYLTFSIWFGLVVCTHPRSKVIK